MDAQTRTDHRLARLRGGRVLPNSEDTAVQADRVEPPPAVAAERDEVRHDGPLGAVVTRVRVREAHRTKLPRTDIAVNVAPAQPWDGPPAHQEATDDRAHPRAVAYGEHGRGVVGRPACKPAAAPLEERPAEVGGLLRAEP